MKTPKKFNRFNSKLHRGVVLSGPPGTGKTLLAKALAGEAGVPYFYASATTFEEKYASVGTSRIINLFNDAKKHAPAVIFIDDIDATGGKQSSPLSNPHISPPINQLLSEMDGLKKEKSVIVIGATNRIEDMDEVLKRPGRFDTQIQLNLPDIKGRQELIELYLNKQTLAKVGQIDSTFWAEKTAGFSGADIQNMINTATIHSANQGL